MKIKEEPIESIIVSFELGFFKKEGESTAPLGIRIKSVDSKDLSEVFKDHPDWPLINTAVNTVNRIFNRAQETLRNEAGLF